MIGGPTYFVMQPNNLIPMIKYQQQIVIPTYVDGHLVEALRDLGSPMTILRRDVLQGAHLVALGDFLETLEQYPPLSSKFIHQNLD